uniref:Uncharacterized protein n=1 Tax=Pseudomonas fluorescens (strain SBW25) TaxID=216595 RepID=A0A0G4E512_PSEFS|nr:hypothetical protein [Pseudomonas fluorescens]CEK42264.1 hypothetical protein PQBR57_0311 [Pseudomonas fluorescens SBW25]
MTNRKHLASLQISHAIGDSTLTATIDPCSFMYPDYGLQMTIMLGEQRGSLHKRLDIDTVTENLAKKLLAQVKVHDCKECSKPALDCTTVKTNQLGLCGDCINTLCEREFEQYMAGDAEELELELTAVKADGKAKGYTHFVTAVIHPAQGDDYFHYMLTKTDDSANIKRKIAKQGSQITTDYKIEVL